MQLEPHELCSLARVCRKTAEWSRQEELEKVWRQWYVPWAHRRRFDSRPESFCARYAKHFGAVVPSVASHRALYNMRERSAVNGCLNHGRFLMVAGEDAIAAPEDAPTEDELSEIAWGHRSFTFLHPGRVCGVAIPHHTVSSPSGRPSLTAGELAQGWLDMYRRPIPDEDLRRLGPDVVDDLLHRGLQLNYGALLFPKRWFGRLDKSGVTQFTT